MKANSTKEVAFGGLTSPTARAADFGYYGEGRTVIANLRELVSGNYVSPENPAHPMVVLQTLPKLDENTDLPNGGTQRPG